MLAHALVSAPSSSPGAEPKPWIALLHGILGAGNNLRSIAKAVVEKRPAWDAVLVDLRLHGLSQDVAPPHDLVACARDLHELATHLAPPARAVLGHSFGGKVAIEWARIEPSLERVIIVDSSPSARPDARGSESTRRVVDLLARLPAWIESRQQFVDLVMAEGHSRDVANWLALNVKAQRDGSFAFVLDVPAITKMLDDYFLRDSWDVMTKSTARFDFVVGGRSTVVDESDRARLRALEAETSGRVKLHLIEDAGHWVHVDAAAELVRITSEALG